MSAFTTADRGDGRGLGTFDILTCHAGSCTILFRFDGVVTRAFRAGIGVEMAGRAPLTFRASSLGLPAAPGIARDRLR